MDKLDIEAAQLIKRIADKTNGQRFPVMSGKVKSVDTDEMTCSVVFSVDGDEATEGVLLNVKLGNASGFYPIPAVNSDCVVAEVDGPGNLWELLKASSYSKIKINGGLKGGLINIDDLVTRLNNIEYDINTLKSIFSGWTVLAGDGGSALRVAAASWYADTLGATSAGDMEDVDVTH
jgi:hypothetical protein